MNLLTAVAIQLESSNHLARNLEVVASLVEQAARDGASLVGLPENFAYFGADEGKCGVAEPADGTGPILRTLRELAIKHALTIVAGGFPECANDPERPYNSACVVYPDGTISAVYRKIHLFDVSLGDGAAYRESASTSAGSEPVVVKAGCFSLGLSICYDLRFPELYRRLVDQGATLLAVPAAFTLMTGKDHWLPLLRARAIESQCYVIAPAQCGSHPGERRTYGKSCIIDPWGELIAQASDGIGVARAVLDLDKVASVRAKLPSLRHRRLRA